MDSVAHLQADSEVRPPGRLPPEQPHCLPHVQPSAQSQGSTLAIDPEIEGLCLSADREGPGAGRLPPAKYHHLSSQLRSQAASGAHDHARNAVGVPTTSALFCRAHTANKTTQLTNPPNNRTGVVLQADREGRAQELADYYLSSQLKASNDQLADKAGSGLLTPEMNKELAVRSATTTNFLFGWKTILKVRDGVSTVLGKTAGHIHAKDWDNKTILTLRAEH